jgi:hypothetical protein
MAGMSTDTLARPDEAGARARPCGRLDGRAWAVLRGSVRALGLPVPPSAGAGLCLTCRGPARPGHARCFECGLHAESAPGLLADTVTPAAYAPKRGPLARDLWVYKSSRPEAGRAVSRLRALLLVFLHDHGWRAWGAAGLGPPTHVCVVPSGRGRPGPHPLQSLASGYLALPWVPLRHRPGADAGARWLDPDRFTVAGSLAGARVLLLDDTWVSGSSAQSAAVALRRAGCESVATVVLGRHLAAGDPPPGRRPAGQRPPRVYGPP